ncbi:hypothetical protein WA026_008118 [Henosepilachna vigintioctopunctata]|uniref:Uncharacterized protein n=1 Tax=Henosepilachna vigintioctopunctata TaxID=420089 RepID=A0AAW1TR68_9CUCU
MNRKNDRKWNIGPNISTYMASYQKSEEKYENLPKYSKDKVEKHAPKPPPEKEIDNETLMSLKKHIPFSLMIVPNEITGRNPYTATPKRLLSDDLHKGSPRERPKVFMTPQICTDDIVDPKLKQFILNEIYTSVSRKNELEFFSMVDIDNTVLKGHDIEDFKQEHQSSVNFNPKPLLRPNMTSQQNEKGKTWTNQQIISNIDANKHFWQKKVIKDIDTTFSCLIKEDVKDQIRDSIQNDNISTAHDYTVPGYAGYKPSNPFGISISKKDLSQKHPFTSTYQSIFNSKRDVTNTPCV